MISSGSGPAKALVRGYRTPTAVLRVRLGSLLVLRPIRRVWLDTPLAKYPASSGTERVGTTSDRLVAEGQDTSGEEGFSLGYI